MNLETLLGINFFATENLPLLIAFLSILVLILLARIMTKKSAGKTELGDYESNSTAKPKLIIEAGRADRQYWKDLWRYRELFYFLAWRDILVRYKQTVIGILWALIRPLLTMVVFTIIFGKLAKLPSNDVPYPILVFAAMLP